MVIELPKSSAAVAAGCLFLPRGLLRSLLSNHLCRPFLRLWVADRCGEIARVIKAGLDHSIRRTASEATAEPENQSTERPIEACHLFASLSLPVSAGRV